MPQVQEQEGGAGLHAVLREDVDAGPTQRIEGTAESSTKSDVRQAVDQGMVVAELPVRDDPRLRGVRLQSLGVDLLRDLRGVASLSSLGEQVCSHVGKTSQLRWIDFTTVLDQQLRGDERRLAALDDNHAQSVWKCFFDRFGKRT